MAHRGAVLPALLSGLLLACSGGEEDAPPSAPRNVIAGASSSTTVEIAWSPSTDDHGVVGYLLYRGPAQIASTGETAFADSGLQASTRYCYDVVAVDTAGHRSARSEQACATTATPHPLTVVKEGPGTVVSSPGGIDCGATCVAPFDGGSWVTLTATPGDGSVFTGWRGCTVWNGTTCTVHVTSPATVTAAFGPFLTVVRAGAGAGTVSSSPEGIDCGSICAAPFTPDSWVTLTASAGSGTLFAGWLGCASASGTTCTVHMAAPTTVAATFVPLLTVVRAGDGAGTVTSSPAGIDCGSTCVAPFAADSWVTLTATAEGGSAFAGWQGCASASGTTCGFQMTAPTTVTASFAVAGSVQVTTATSGPEPDPDGFRLELARADGTILSVPVPVAGTTPVENLVPGPHRASLWEVAPNCDVSPGWVMLDVVGGGTANLAFDITCPPDRGLAVLVDPLICDLYYGCWPTGDTEIYSVRSNGTGLRQLTDSPSANRDFVWSPDGSRIGFVSYRDGNPEIYVMDADGSNQARLTTDPSSDGAFTWSPDGSRIAFVSDRDGSPEVYAMAADGSSQIRLTAEPASDHSPAWSPDGTRIAFVSERDGNPEIYVMDAEGSNQTRLTVDPASDVAPAWSPDGSRIAFVRQAVDRRDGSQINVMSADGAVSTALPRNRSTSDVGRPAWSPDGTRIAFDESGPAGSYWEWTGIAVASADGADVSWVIGNLDYVHYCEFYGSPAWSPNGRHLAFVAGDSGGCMGDYYTQISDWEMGAWGQGSGGRAEDPWPWLAGVAASAPAWRP